MNGRVWPNGVLPRGNPMTQRNRDDLADAIEGEAYWAMADGDDGPSQRRICKRVAKLIARVTAALRGDTKP